MEILSSTRQYFHFKTNKDLQIFSTYLFYSEGKTGEKMVPRFLEIELPELIFFTHWICMNDHEYEYMIWLQFKEYKLTSIDS